MKYTRQQLKREMQKMKVRAHDIRISVQSGTFEGNKDEVIINLCKFIETLLEASLEQDAR